MQCKASLSGSLLRTSHPFSWACLTSRTMDFSRWYGVSAAGTGVCVFSCFSLLQERHNAFSALSSQSLVRLPGTVKRRNGCRAMQRLSIPSPTLVTGTRCMRPYLASRLVVGSGIVEPGQACEPRVALTFFSVLAMNRGLT